MPSSCGFQFSSGQPATLMKLERFSPEALRQGREGLQGHYESDLGH